MNYTTTIESLSNFNERVLMKGTIKNDEICRFESIKNKLFFNSIFISNMKEVFQKYTIREIVEVIPNYIDDLKIYNKNLKDIIKYLKCKLLLVINLNKFSKVNINNLEIIDNINDLDDYHNYYLTITKDQKIIIYKCTKKIVIKNGYEYLNVSKSIKNELNKRFKGLRTIMFNIVHRDETNEIIKMEIDQDLDQYEDLIRSIFSRRMFLIINPLLNLDEINNVIKNNYRSIDHYIPDQTITIKDIMKKDYLIYFPEVSFDCYLNLIEDGKYKDEVVE